MGSQAGKSCHCVEQENAQPTSQQCRRDMDDASIVEIVFTVVADTTYGSRIKVVGSSEELGNWCPATECGVLEHLQYPRWSTTIQFRSQPRTDPVEYKFIIVQPDGHIVWEDGANRRLPFWPSSGSRAELAPARFGQWEATAFSSVCLSKKEPVSASLSAGTTDGEVKELVSASLSAGSVDGEVKVCFEVECKSECSDVFIVGSIDSLGCWNPNRGLPLVRKGTAPIWKAEKILPSVSHVQWKVVIRRALGAFDWENGANRCFPAVEKEMVDCLVVKCKFDGRDAEYEPQARRKDVNVKNTHLISADALLAKTISEGTKRENEPLVDAAAGSTLSRRCHSMTLLTPSFGDVPLAASLSTNLAEGRPRRNSFDGAVQEQLIILNLADVQIENENAAALKVEVLVEENSSKHVLVYEQEKERWTVQVQLLNLVDGFHAFHFLVCGVRIVSSAHAVRGEYNVAIFSDSLRKYLVAHDSRLFPAEDIAHDSRLFPAEDIAEIRKISSAASLSSWSGSKPFSPRTGSLEPSQQRLGLGSQPRLGLGGRAGGLVRPLSHAGNLNAMVDSDSEDDRPPMPIELARTPSAFATVNGFFNREYSWRLDKVLTRRRSPRKGVRLWPGANRIGKPQGCEDAYFCDEYAAGVADGVGSFKDFKRFGCNAAEYAQELMDNARMSVQQSMPKSSCIKQECLEMVDVAEPELVPERAKRRAQVAIEAASNGAQAFGGSTILVLVLDGQTIGVANLGDSGFMLLRRVAGGMSIVKRSSEQQHSFNCPYQLMRIPPELAKRVAMSKSKPDTASDCQLYAVDAQEGDLLLLFTDGMSDNIFESEILDIVNGALSPEIAELLGIPADQSTTPDNIAKALATAAHERSTNEVVKTPWAEYCGKHGMRDVKGGKQDDITVLAAWVMPELEDENTMNARQTKQAEKVQAALAAANIESDPPPKSKRSDVVGETNTPIVRDMKLDADCESTSPKICRESSNEDLVVAQLSSMLHNSGRLEQSCPLFETSSRKGLSPRQQTYTKAEYRPLSAKQKSVTKKKKR